MALISKTDKSTRSRILYYTIYVVITIWVLLYIFPLYWIIRSSVSNKIDVNNLSLIPSLSQVAIIEIDSTDFIGSAGESKSIEEVKKILDKDAVVSIFYIFENFARINQVNAVGTLEGKKILEVAITRFNAKPIRSEYPRSEDYKSNASIIMNTFKAKYYQVESGENNFNSIDNYEDLSSENEFAQNLQDKIIDVEDISSDIKVYSVAPSILRMFDSYREAWRAFGQLSFGRYFLNSAVYVIGVLIINLTVSSLAAYALSRLLSKRLSRVLLIFFVLTLMIPEILLYVPLFLIMKQFPFSFLPHINLINTYWGLILPHSAWGFSILLFKGFFDKIPLDLVEAARIDGASEINIFWRIVLPLSKAVFGVVAVFLFMAVWTNFLWPFIITQQKKMWTFTVALYNLQDSRMMQALGQNVVMAASATSIIPSIIMFFIFQRFIQKGIALTGIKG